MNRDLQSLADHTFDVIVVGGGIFGLCAARDAALRGLSVALLEKGDFGHATSANHFKFVHGGIRYLQHGDLVRVRRSSRERSAWLRVAPHLVWPLPVVVPTYGHARQGKEMMTVAMAAYDLLTADRNRGLSPTSRVTRSHTISRSAALDRFPFLATPDLTGAAVFDEAQIYNPPRLSLAVAQSAAASGAVLANYVEVKQLVLAGDAVRGVIARDGLSQVELEVTGRVVLNAAGPWAGNLVQRALGRPLRQQPTFSRDACFVVGRRLVDEAALGVQVKTRDPDALLSRGNRHVFLAPWRDYTLVGVWHVVHQGAPEDFRVTTADLESFLDELNAACPRLSVTLQDVSLWNAGLTLFGQNEPGARHLRYGHRSQLVDHAADHGLEGLVTLIGERFTTARDAAARAIDLVSRKLGRSAPRPRTDWLVLPGAEFDSFDRLQARAAAIAPAELPAAVLQPLLRNYGTVYQELFAIIAADPSLAQSLGPEGSAATVIRAEVVRAVRQEMAGTLADVVFRRTDLGTGAHPGAAALRACADLMAAELGWGAARRQSELARVEARFPQLPEKAGDLR